MSETKLCTPKFLTLEIARLAVQSALEAVFDGYAAHTLQPKHRQLHVVVLVPGMKEDRPDYPKWPNYQIQPVVLHECTLGNVADFPYPFDDIARWKAFQLWPDRNDDRTEIIPHLLFPGDTPFWGGVKRQGIVVACSGIQPWEDKLISSVSADFMIALAYNAWMMSADKSDDELCFLT